MSPVTGVIDVTCDDAQDLLAAADMLQLADVVDVCCRFLTAELHPSNCIGMLLDRTPSSSFLCQNQTIPSNEHLVPFNIFCSS